MPRSIVKETVGRLSLWIGT
jgi:hypothetical protein